MGNLNTNERKLWNQLTPSQKQLAIRFGIDKVNFYNDFDPQIDKPNQKRFTKSKININIIKSIATKFDNEAQK